MQIVRKIQRHLSRLKRPLIFIYDRLRGLPPITYSEISKELLWECVGKQDPTILEIGCNDGGHTLWFLEIFENPRVYCFEPDPRAIDRFKSNVGQRSNVKLFEMAISDQIGKVAFYQSAGQIREEMPHGWDLSGSIRKPKEHLITHPKISFDNQIDVKTTTLDAWCEKNSIEQIDLIWMDVQGAEIDVFRGAKNTLTKTRFIYTEYCNRELYAGQLNLKSLLKYLANFQAVIRYPNDVLLSAKNL